MAKRPTPAQLSRLVPDPRQAEEMRAFRHGVGKHSIRQSPGTKPKKKKRKTRPRPPRDAWPARVLAELVKADAPLSTTAVAMRVRITATQARQTLVKLESEDAVLLKDGGWTVPS